MSSPDLPYSFPVHEPEMQLRRLVNTIENILGEDQTSFDIVLQIDYLIGDWHESEGRTEGRYS